MNWGLFCFESKPQLLYTQLSAWYPSCMVPVHACRYAYRADESNFGRLTKASSREQKYGGDQMPSCSRVLLCNH